MTEPAGEWLPGQVGRRVVVHTSNDQSMDAVLSLVSVEGILLRAAKLLGASSIDLAGETWVPRSQVAFIQFVGDSIPPAPVAAA